MRVLVVFGAGASSTFVAHRIRRAATARGLDLVVDAFPFASALTGAGHADVVLVGDHVGDVEPLRAAVAAPLFVITDAARQDGDVLLDRALAAAGTPHPERTP